MHLLLITLSGIFFAGAVLHLFRARESEYAGSHFFLSALCLLPAVFLQLQAAEYGTIDLGETATLRRWQAMIAGLFLVVYPWFLARVTKVGDRKMPAILSALGAVVAIRGATSASGLWLSSIEGVRATQLPWGETIHQAIGKPSAWIGYTLGLWILLTVYGVVCARRYGKLPEAVGARGLVAFHALFFVFMVNDLMLDAGLIASVPLSLFSAPVLVGGMWWRMSAEENRRIAALRELFREAGDATVIQDAATGAIRQSNNAASRIFAHSPAELVGAKIDDLVVASDRAGFDAAVELVRELRGLDPEIVEARCQRRPGEEIHLQMSVRFAVLEGLDSIVVGIRDVTALKRAEADKIQLGLQMLHAQRLESLGVLAGGIAHDFNNFLTAILGRLSLGQKRLAAGEDARKHLEDAALTVRRAADLCQQMLVYAGKSSPKVGPIELSALVDEMGQMIGVTVGKHIQLERDLAHSLPQMRGNASQLRQVVLNLISNAADAIGGQLGRITLRTRRVDVASMTDTDFVNGSPAANDCVAVEVSDNGSGMNDDTRKRMFDPFFSTKFTGRGLGMSTVLGIVRDHGGALAVASQLGRGTTITAYFPAHPEGLAVEAKKPEPIAIGDLRILVVDDDPAIRILTATMIEDLGGQAVQVSSGAQALELCEQRPPPVQAAIVDLNMPGMDGIAVINELRSRHQRMPIVLTSGYPNPDLDRFLRRQNAVTFLKKPYDLEALSEAFVQAGDKA